MRQYVLKPIDIVVLCALLARAPDLDWTQAVVAQAIGISQSNVHRALRQLERSGLWSDRAPRKLAVQALLVHGVRYVYPPELGAPARGVPTAHAGPAIAGHLRFEQPYVWPWAEGPSFGTSLRPLHEGVPRAASADPRFHEWMALVDVFRIGRAREVRIAEEWLDHELGAAG